MPVNFSNGLPSRTEDHSARILLVDDEIAILDGLRRQLRKKFQVHTANSGVEALEFLQTRPVSVVVSDMRMPQRDGATFLSRVRALHPDVVRILLTGQSDTQSAITAVNEGQIYRFLTKPCPPEVLLQEIGSAVELNRLMTAEKEVLASTVRRTVEALTATLSLAQPAAPGWKASPTRSAGTASATTALGQAWAPPGGRGEGEDLPLTARILRLAVDFDAGMSQRPSVQATISALRADAGAYDPRVLAALVTAHDVPDGQAPPRAVDVDDLAPGLIIFDDVYTTEGVLLVSRGTEVTDALILRIENYARQDRVERQIRVHD